MSDITSPIPSNASEMLEQVRAAAAKRILFLPHALKQMNAPDRMITPLEVRVIIFSGIIIEDYPEDVRGHSCLMLGYGDADRPIHIVCSPKGEYLAIITVYLPGSDQWATDWSTRRKR